MNTEPPQDDSSADHKNEMEASHKQAAAPDCRNAPNQQFRQFTTDTKKKTIMFDEHTEPGGPNPAQPDSENHNTTLASFTACRDQPPDLPDPERNALVIYYSFGPYSILIVVLYRGVAYCGIDSAGEFAGLPTSIIIGNLPEDEEHTKGAPGHLDPDGITDLRPFGIPDEGIHLDAVKPYVLQNRAADPRAIKALDYISEDIVSLGHAGILTDRNITCDCWSLLGYSGENDPYFTDKRLIYHRYYHPEFGEMWAVVVGCRVWLRIKDVEFATNLDAEALIEIAQVERILCIPGYSIRDTYDREATNMFVRLDVVEKIAAAMHWGMGILDGVSHWVKNDLLSSRKLEARGACVLASTLHCMLGAHLPFEAWLAQMQIKFWEIISRDPHCDLDEIDCDSIFPVTIARDIALNEQTFAGIVTARLLTNGGVFHGGTFAETPDETLLRFLGLVPDCEGCVSVQKLWEFSGTSSPYHEWYQRGLDCLPSGEGPPLDGRVPINSWWCGFVWTNNWMPSI